MYEYTQQPPSTTLSSCNPYHNDNIIFIAIDCIVKYQTNEFEIRWFRENTTGAVEDLGLGYSESLNSGNMHWLSRYHGSFNQQYNPSYLGKYWCQVINTTADPDQPLMRSNVFTLLAPENYTQPTCVNQSTTIQTMTNITCADLPVHSEQTTLPAPTTTLSLYVSVNPNKYAEFTSFQLSPFDTAVDPTTSSLMMPTKGHMIVLVSVVGVCAVVLLLIVCSSLIVILIVIHQRRRRKKKTQNYSTSKDNG